MTCRIPWHSVGKDLVADLSEDASRVLLRRLAYAPTYLLVGQLGWDFVFTLSPLDEFVSDVNDITRAQPRVSKEILGDRLVKFSRLVVDLTAT